VCPGMYLADRLAFHLMVATISMFKAARGLTKCHRQPIGFECRFIPRDDKAKEMHHFPTISDHLSSNSQVTGNESSQPPDQVTPSTAPLVTITSYCQHRKVLALRYGPVNSDFPANGDGDNITIAVDSTCLSI
ncbi:17615_t:CDS:2, partial [Acaulospora colombiana]